MLDVKLITSINQASAGRTLNRDSGMKKDASRMQKTANNVFREVVRSSVCSESAFEDFRVMVDAELAVKRILNTSMNIVIAAVEKA